MLLACKNLFLKILGGLFNFILCFWDLCNLNLFLLFLLLVNWLNIQESWIISFLWSNQIRNRSRSTVILNNFRNLIYELSNSHYIIPFRIFMWIEKLSIRKDHCQYKIYISDSVQKMISFTNVLI